jgi:1-deoxy-D-xylulose-5-phosphate reductoisomerase
LVKEACVMGGAAAAVLSAADEVAVERFLAGEIRYTDIPRILEHALTSAGHLPCGTVEDVLSAAALTYVAALLVSLAQLLRLLIPEPRHKV